METTMYEDGYSQYSRESLTQIKRRLTLDLTSRPSKRQRQGGGGGGAAGNFNPLLTSPDLNQLKLASPELERLIMQQSGAAILGGGGGGGGGAGGGGGGVTGGSGVSTTTITTSSTGSQFFFPKTATVEEEEFAKGFEDTLEQLHHQEAVALAAAATGGGGGTTSTGLQYTTLEVPSAPSVTASAPPQMSLLPPSHIKEEPQTVPSVGGSPPVSPINMECQERIKLERKRLRNRIAASKCRRRKLERIGRLEDKVRQLKGENVELQNVVNRLRDQVCSLKQEVMEHVNSGCQIPFVTTHHQ